MEVRLTCRWGSFLQGTIVSVSVARAEALVEAGYGKFVKPPAEAEKVEVKTAPKVTKKK